MSTIDEIRRLLGERPGMTATELAQATGVSRQRVHQLLQKHNLPYGKWVRAAPRVSGGVPEYVTRWQVGVGRVSMPPTRVGTISELLVAADLLARGWFVFVPLARTVEIVDLVAVSADGEVVKRIEVKTGTKKPDGGISYNRNSTSALDHYAVVVDQEPVIYIPPIGCGKDTNAA